MGLKLTYVNGNTLGVQLKQRARNFSERQTRAVQQVAREVAEKIEVEGRDNIRSGGNFGSERWQEGLKAKVSFESRSDITVRLTHDVPYWVVFEEGRTIRGKPLLWIPLAFGDANKVRARDYPGKLFRVDRQGKNPLLMSDTGPQYVGVSSVRIPKKWSLRAMVRRISRTMSQLYKEAMSNGG